MKISIKPKWYINCPPPSLTKGMMDFFYTRIKTIINQRCSEISKLETIKTTVERAYVGCSIVHFYIYINGGERIHFTYSTGDEFTVGPHHWFNGESEYSEGYHRGDWLAHLSGEFSGIDIGTDKPRIALEARRKVMEDERQREREENNKRHRYSEYLRLKKEFGVYSF